MNQSLFSFSNSIRRVLAMALVSIAPAIRGEPVASSDGVDARICFSPDGQKQAWVSGQSIEFSAADSTARRSFAVSGIIHDLVFRRDGNSLALAGSLDGKGSVRLLDTRTGSIRDVLRTENPLISIRYTADGQWLATIDSNGEVIIRNEKERLAHVYSGAVAADTLAAGLTWLGENKDFAFQKALFPGSHHQWLAWVEEGGHIRLWKVGDEHPPQRLKSQSIDCEEVQFSANAEFLLARGKEDKLERYPTANWLSDADDGAQLKAATRSLPREELALFRPMRSPDSRLVAEADKLQARPKLDGDLSDWINTRRLPFAPGLEHFTTAPGFRLRDDGATEAPGAAGTALDLSGEVMLGWDDDAIYLAANVRDNVVDITGAVDSPPDYWWHRDSVSLFLDVPRDGDGEPWRPGDHAFSFIPDPERPPHSKWWRRGDASGRLETPAPDSVEIHFQINDNGYTLEAAIPMAVLQSQTPDWLPPYDEKTVGFMFIVTDPDGNPADPFGGELIYGGDNDNDGQWAGLRLVNAGVSAPPRMESPVAGASVQSSADSRIVDILENLQLPVGFEVNLFATVPRGPSRMAFAPDGRLFVTAGGWGKGGKAWALTDEDGDGVADRREVVIEELDTPMGLCFQGENNLYVAHNRSTVSLYHTGPAGTPATFVRDILLTGKSNGHGIGPVIQGPDGKLYCAQGSDGDVVVGDSEFDCTVWRMNPDGSAVEPLASGLRFAFGLAFDSHGQLFATEQGPDHKPIDHSDELNLIEPGSNFGFPNVFTDPTNAIGHVPPIARFAEHSSACGLTFYNGGAFPKEYKDNAFAALWGPADTHHVDLVSNPRPDWDAYYIARVQLQDGKEPVVSRFAGDFRHPADVATGPDGAMYVADWGSTGAGGSQNGADGDGAIYRIVYTGGTAAKD